MKFKIQVAYGSAVELNRFDDAKWIDKIAGFNCLTLDECRRELIYDIKMSAFCDLEEFEECYTHAIDRVYNATTSELIDGFVVSVSGREKAWRIVED